jgi:predicted O-methyltransferase YrrM
MFLDIPPLVRDRMAELERVDNRDRIDGTRRLERLRQITPETGKFIALLAACAPPGVWLEIGTSAGYSALWLALAGRQLGRRLTTFELLEDKAALAAETFRLAEVEPVVELVFGNALDYLPAYKEIAFCFLDAEKDVYRACYEAVIPNLVSGGLLVADNAINQRDILQPMLDRAQNDSRVDALIVPIGKGELVCRKR